MYWQRISTDQMQAVQSACKNKQVLDIGAFNAALASKLIEGGARHVTTLDKEDPLFDENRFPAEISKIVATFQEFNRSHTNKNWAVGILAWPINSDYAVRPLLPILSRCKTVIYIGSNQSGSQCGTPMLWSYLSQREVLAYLPSQTNSVVIYGSQPRQTARLIEEEELGLLLKIL